MGLKFSRISPKDFFPCLYSPPSDSSSYSPKMAKNGKEVCTRDLTYSYQPSISLDSEILDPRLSFHEFIYAAIDKKHLRFENHKLAKSFFPRKGHENVFVFSYEQPNFKIPYVEACVKEINTFSLFLVFHTPEYLLVEDKEYKEKHAEFMQFALELFYVHYHFSSISIFYEKRTRRAMLNFLNFNMVPFGVNQLNEIDTSFEISSLDPYVLRRMKDFVF